MVQEIDPDALEDVVGRWSRPRIHLARALAADGRRIRGANRNGDGHHDTVALVDHASGALIVNRQDTRPVAEAAQISSATGVTPAIHRTRTRLTN